MKPTIRVVAAVIANDERRVLVTQRTPGRSLAGQWEFPGGKVETGETEAAALRRELKEELGVQVGSARAAFALTHEYAERHVELSVWIVDDYAGEPRGLEGQPLRWEHPAGLRELPLLPADLALVDWLETTVFAN